MPTVEEVEVAFREWRTSKKQKYERIPEELISMAKGLLIEHTAGTVAFRLGISPSRLSKPTESEIPRVESPKFVEVPGSLIPQPLVVTIRVRPGSRNEIILVVPQSLLNWPELFKGLSKL